MSDKATVHLAYLCRQCKMSFVSDSVSEEYNKGDNLIDILKNIMDRHSQKIVCHDCSLGMNNTASVADFAGIRTYPDK